jgi:hypothetical protein
MNCLIDISYIRTYNSLISSSKKMKIKTIVKNWQFTLTNKTLKLQETKNFKKIIHIWEKKSYNFILDTLEREAKSHLHKVFKM